MLFRRKSRSSSSSATSSTANASLIVATKEKQRKVVSSGLNASVSSLPEAPTESAKLGRNTHLQRSVSLPSSFKGYSIKGILKISTVDDSLHSVYGESKDDSTTKSNCRIQFKDLLIREYARTVGDNPSCSSGPPVSIAWEYNPETKVIAVDKYENLRPPRRTHFEMVLPRDVRHQMLRYDWNVSQAQIASAVRNNIRIKNQRRSTINNLGKAEKMEEFFETAGSKLKQGIFFQKSTTSQVRELEEMHQKAERLRAQARLEERMAAMNFDMSESYSPQDANANATPITAQECSDDSSVGPEEGDHHLHTVVQLEFSSQSVLVQKAASSQEVDSKQPLQIEVEVPTSTSQSVPDQQTATFQVDGSRELLLLQQQEVPVAIVKNEWDDGHSIEEHSF